MMSPIENLLPKRHLQSILLYDIFDKYYLQRLRNVSDSILNQNCHFSSCKCLVGSKLGPIFYLNSTLLDLQIPVTHTFLLKPIFIPEKWQQVNTAKDRQWPPIRNRLQNISPNLGKLHLLDKIFELSMFGSDLIDFKMPQLWTRE